MIVQPATGFWLAHTEGIGLKTPWLATTLCLYVMVGACWLPIVWLQIRMHRFAREAKKTNGPLDGRYETCAKAWFVLGWPAFSGVVAIFYLMVEKPGFG